MTTMVKSHWDKLPTEIQQMILKIEANRKRRQEFKERCRKVNRKLNFANRYQSYTDEEYTVFGYNIHFLKGWRTWNFRYKDGECVVAHSTLLLNEWMSDVSGPDTFRAYTTSNILVFDSYLL